MSKLSVIADYVNHLSIDLKAETLIAMLLKDSLDTKDIIIAFDGQLKRKYTKDVSKALLYEFESGEKAITFHLNRDGIYDALPESLFHSFSEEALVRGEEMARDSMKLKNEEKEARSFFEPFESQIFFQLANLASRENSLFNNMYSRLLQGLIPDFWNISREIPLEFADRLIRMIPMAHKIVGDIELTTQAFEFVLNEKVLIEFNSAHGKQNVKNSTTSLGVGLGEGFLGIDTFSGNMPEIFIGNIRISVGPICHLEINQYLKGGWIKTLLDYLCSYFLPMELAVNTIMIPGRDQTEFVLNEAEPEKNSYLGYNSVL